jgi:uncharacterized protein (TIGR00251 family)
MDTGKLDIIERAGGIEFTVKVVPGASRTKVAGLWGAALKLAVAAPPEGGQANGAVTRLLAEVLGVKPAQVSIVGGLTKPLKRIAVAGQTSARARVRLAELG